MTEQIILLTNDDGPDSPLLGPFSRALGALFCCAELRIIIPAEEQSWIAKSITRFRPLTTTSHHFDGTPGYLVSGTPADCVSLGLNNLYPERAALVVSGINMGTNAGVPFMFSSGTIGGAIEAALYDIPALAFSLDVPKEIFRAWSDRALASELSSDFERIAQTCATVAERLIAKRFWEHAALFTINVPWEVTEDTPARLARLSHARFVKLFTEIGENRFQHRIDALKMVDEPAQYKLPADFDILRQGMISITPLNLDLTAAIADSFLE